MIISLIAVLTTNYVIGRENTIPWHFDIDVDWFKYYTLNKPVIMGRKTFESLGKRSLPGRFNIVLSNKLLYHNIDNVVIVNDPMRALYLVQELDEIMIIGGSALYNIFISQCTRMYLTYINFFYGYGDSWFPRYDMSEWKSVFNARILYNINYAQTKCVYNLNFKILERC